MSLLAEDRYGKSRVRLVKVLRRGEWHDIHEWTFEILLEGDFESCFVDGDNSKILPTDTMKNTVYSLARKSPAECMEDFAKELAAFFLERNSQVHATSIAVSEKSWRHLETRGTTHPSTFVQSGGERQTTRVAMTRNGTLSVESGLENLVVLKTANSAFLGFVKDELTTLGETTDRLFGTAVRARWKYSSAALPFAPLRSAIRETLLSTFAAHTSKSVQHTLYAMGQAALAAVPDIDEIELTLPNVHCLLVDLSRFGQDNPNEIFVPTDEPSGYIEARLRRPG